MPGVLNAVYYISFRLLSATAESLPGDTTLNQLRIMHVVHYMTAGGEPTSVSEIADALDMPRSGVSRVITELVSYGWVKEEPHPEDGRRRLLVANSEKNENAFRIEQNLYESILDVARVVFTNMAEAGHINREAYQALIAYVDGDIDEATRNRLRRNPSRFRWAAQSSPSHG